MLMKLRLFSLVFSTIVSTTLTILVLPSTRTAMNTPFVVKMLPLILVGTLVARSI